MRSFIVLLFASLSFSTTNPNPTLPNIHYGMSKSSLLKYYPQYHFRSSTTFDKTFLDSTQVPDLEILYCDKFPMFGIRGKLGSVFSNHQLQYASWISYSPRSIFDTISSFLDRFGQNQGESIGYNGRISDGWITFDNKDYLDLSYLNGSVVYGVRQNWKH